MTQKEYLTRLCEDNKDAVIIGSLGTISYDLKDIEHPNKILIKGAMGAAIGAGLGYAMNSDKEVIVVVGDGSFLMKMGMISTVQRLHPTNLRIIIINNDCYLSCGKQPTFFFAVKQMLPYEVFEPTLPA